MPPKSRQKHASSSVWHLCDSCRVVLSQKDVDLHQQSCCPPPAQGWSHGFIKQKVIHSWIRECPADVYKSTSLEKNEDIVWVSSSVLKMSGICVGDPVLVEALGVPSIKTAWPVDEKSISHIYLSKDGLEFTPDCCNAAVTVRKLPHPFPPAHEVVVALQTEDSLVNSHLRDILLILRSLYCEKYIQAGSILNVPHYGRKLKFQVESVSPLPKTSCKSVDPQTPLVDSMAESFQQLSFQESKVEKEVFCSTPLQSKQNLLIHSVLEKSLDSNSQLANFAPAQDATPVRKTFRMMTEDSYGENSVEGSKDEPSFSYSTSLESETEPNASGLQFYHITCTSQWRLKNVKEEEEKSSVLKNSCLSSIGGLEEVVEELLEIMKLALNPSQPLSHGLKIARGALLFGPPGTGKTVLAQALAYGSKAAVHSLQGAELFSKLLGETETRLRDFFSNAMLSGPTVIILDEIDSLCPKKSGSSGSSELERRVASTLSTLLDSLNRNNKSRVFVLATTSRLDSVDPVIRRPGRLDHEVEIPVPSPNARLDILAKLLKPVPHLLSEKELKSIAQATHGFVGADLASLVSQAGMQAFQTSTESLPVPLNIHHMNWALSRIHPSAMREVLVDVPNVHWSDIGGQEDLKLKLQQAVEWPLTHPEAFQRLGIDPPKGILMFGPPGCSKTMIAKALATESKLNFLSIKGPELFSKWVGESERAVREVFRKARQVAPSVVFFDEIDALGGERSTGGSSGASNVQERVLAQLLTEMDGVTALKNVTVVAATNRPDRIDKALLRPGRLDRIVYVPLPDKCTRKQIFTIQMKKMPISKDINTELLVKSTDGYSGAEVLAVCHEAALKALEEDINAQVILEKHFSEALKIVTPRTPPSLLKLYEEYLTS